LQEGGLQFSRTPKGHKFKALESIDERAIGPAKAVPFRRIAKGFSQQLGWG